MTRNLKVHHFFIVSYWWFLFVYIEIDNLFDYFLLFYTILRNNMIYSINIKIYILKLKNSSLIKAAKTFKNSKHKIE